MIRQCCQCRKIEVNGRWVYPRFSQLEGKEVSHGYCPECHAAIRREMHAKVRVAPILARLCNHLKMTQARPIEPSVRP